jgi:ankyrin repeat protein
MHVPIPRTNQADILLRGGADVGTDADVNKANNDGVTPLLTASQNWHCDVVDAFFALEPT